MTLRKHKRTLETNTDYETKFRQAVIKRDKGKCVACSKKIYGKIYVHHLNGWNKFPTLRYEPRNGVSLCYKCHNLFHDEYGRGDNTEYQFDDFLMRHFKKKLKSIPR